MLRGLSLTVFLLLATSSAITTGLRVNCSSRNLVELPPLSSNTTELHVQNNRITTVPAGLFDRLVSLEKVTLSGNPFHCDCKIQYLRSWLLKNRGIVSKEPTCASPRSVAQKAITELSDDHFSSCAPASCAEGIYNIVMGLMLCCVIVLSLWCLKLAKTCTFTLSIDEKHMGFEAHSLHSRKPKHRRRLYSSLEEDDEDLNSHSVTGNLQRPLLNMELLPQVLDVLHKKHNIKIKST